MPMVGDLQNKDLACSSTFAKVALYKYAQIGFSGHQVVNNAIIEYVN